MHSEWAHRSFESSRAERSVNWLLIVICASACAVKDEAGLRAAQARMSRVAGTYDSVERRLTDSQRRAIDLAHRAEATRQAWLDAQATYSRVAKVNSGAAGHLDQAASDYAEATRAFRRATTILIVAALWDLFVTDVCGPRVSTHQYREQLRAAGIDPDGLDVDHKFPRSLGGPDRPWNYELLDPSLNRSLGADLLQKFELMPLDTLDALAKTAGYHLLCAD